MLSSVNTMLYGHTETKTRSIMVAVFLVMSTNIYMCYLSLALLTLGLSCQQRLCYLKKLVIAINFIIYDLILIAHIHELDFLIYFG